MVRRLADKERAKAKMEAAQLNGGVLAAIGEMLESFGRTITPGRPRGPLRSL